MKLRSYERVWKIENKIYAIQNIRLPIPLNPSEILYFFGTDFTVFILSKIIPPIAAIPEIIAYIVLPYLITKFLRKKKLDGKPPHKFFVAYVKYLLDRGNNRQFFRVVAREQIETVKLNWSCTSRNM